MVPADLNVCWISEGIALPAEPHSRISAFNEIVDNLERARARPRQDSLGCGSDGVNIGHCGINYRKIVSVEFDATLRESRRQTMNPTPVNDDVMRQLCRIGQRYQRVRLAGWHPGRMGYLESDQTVMVGPGG